MSLIEPVLLTLEPRAFDAVTPLASITSLGPRQFEAIDASIDIGVIDFSAVRGIQFDRPAILVVSWDGNPIDTGLSTVTVRSANGTTRYTQSARTSPDAFDNAGELMIMSRKDQIIIDSNGTTSPRVFLALLPLDARSLAEMSCCLNPGLNGFEVREGPLVNPGAPTQIALSGQRHLIQQVQPDAGDDDFLLPIGAEVGQLVTVINADAALPVEIFPPPTPVGNRINFTAAAIPFAVPASGGTEKNARTFQLVQRGIGQVEEWAVVG